MNCENYQILLSDLVDGSLAADDCATVELHLTSCPECADAHADLRMIIDICHQQRGQYDDVPNERAMWLRIINLIEAEKSSPDRSPAPQDGGWWFRLMNRSWQLSFPQLAGLVSGIVLVVAMATAFSMYRLASSTDSPRLAGLVPASVVGPTLEDRYRQRQQMISYWNQRVELNKARWNPQMRETFDRNMSVIDAAVTDSMKQLKQNPHDSVSEDILNDALNDKVALLKEFSDL
ncbi:MAG: anti-sigma factor [Pyrinomonadaceae bacterium]